ncbi:hypothetical protein B0T18DRAFT_423449 [Schizothecium vesticola]|uniref:Uncharacterized protein n=1 Tax=Schizothecium vesticola TaxID=314040 RepID=A0AA40KB89_9PEZI|nr:hypothetical protein B0T18DRAFT_423449 [Schizothecium vesticola]
MPRIPFNVALAAFLVLLLSSVTAGNPITETPDGVVEASRARPPCTGNDGCVNYAHRRCGDPFASARCIQGFCCASCRDKC